MATMNISLPDDLKSYVEAQVRTGLYANVSDFVRDAIRDRRDAIKRLDDLVQEGIDSGWSDLSFDEIIAQAKEQAKSRAS
jgi:antitoxin ParD1/3/4